MPHVALEIPQTYQSITRPVVSSILADLIERLDMGFNARTQFIGNAGSIAQSQTSLLSEEESVYFPFAEKVAVDFNELYLEEGVLNTAIKENDNILVFNDTNLSVSMKPVYTKTQLQLSIRYYAKDHTQMNQFRDKLRRRATEGREELLHEIHYHYGIPEAFMVILKEIYTKREAVCGYGDSYEQYIAKHITDRITGVSNLDGSIAVPVIPEKQIQILGWFDFKSEVDKESKNKEGDEWVVEFNYQFQYDKVTAMVLKYPIVVHNQLIDEKYLNLEHPYNPYLQPRRNSLNTEDLDYFSYHSRTPKTQLESVKIPFFDDFKPVADTYKTYPIFTSLIGIDFDYPHFIIDLNDLDLIQIEPDLLLFIKESKQDIFYYSLNPIHITFYRGSIASAPDTIFIDENLKIYSHIPLQCRDVHHLRFSILYDLTKLARKGEDLLLKHASVCCKIIDIADGVTRPGTYIPESTFYDETV